MSSFTQHPPLLPLEDGIHWQVMEDFEYHIGSEDSNDFVKVPKGYVSDLASIPRFLWGIIGGPWGKYGYAAIVHDFILQNKLYPPSKADRIFYEAMTVLKVPSWKCSMIFFACRMYHLFQK